ncbi:uncharacterized protein I206_107031 [Kwoniella pini CBS 10737]|uniref:Protein Zds1 C-terminal domain-containing protein n=1 Tax=Kwoniella pini CBS 10737 TaxID=1296096 RepID=A0A1B9HZE4_9TREE|nr:uncharacterized protein I206_05426 [Kwoniella pini CBS 10737]OCF48646.1 hypothetical protein I206_05426 [Kwoniella pini CBS 10737]
MPSEVSDQEIEREINTLRGLRRRSVTSSGPGALPLDPDLPPPSPPSRPESSGSLYDTDNDITLSTPDGLSGEDAGLFWVPAHLHPELAPGEFRAFLKSHTHPDPTHADESEAGEAPGLSRSSSWLARNSSKRGNEGLGRKRSMLSRQYQPKLGDNVENEAPPLPTRRPASIYGGRSGEKGLTLNDLQKLEELVDEAEDVDDDPEAMRHLLRRSLSMNVAPGFLQDDIPLGGEIDDEPLIPSSRPGSILRRSARTKIRGKASLSGDGGGHRFAATRKGRMTAAPQRELPVFDDEFDYSDRTKKSSTGTTSSAGGSDENASAESHEEKEVFHDSVQHLEERRGSDESTDEAHIFDAYARDSRSSSMSSSSQDHSTSPSPESSPPGKKLSLPPMITTSPYQSDGSDWFASDNDHDRTPTQEIVRDPLSGIRRTSPGAEAQFDRPAIPALSSGPNLQIPDDSSMQKPPSPSTSQQRPSSLSTDQYTLPPGMAPPAQRISLPPGMALQQQQEQPQTQVPPQPVEQNLAPVDLERPNLARVESAVPSASSTGGKEKEKEKQKKGGLFGKKDKKDKDGKSKKDKDSKFLGSLFGSNKKKQEEISSVANFSSAGPAAAAALLGSSKSAKSLGVPPSPSPTSPGFSSYARYPIHVERAVYRLSHIKLANARRPLYEQVLISNLMFWYLGVIGRNVTEEKKSTSSDPENKKEEVKAPVKGTPPKPADSGSAGKPLPRTNPLESPAPTPGPPITASSKKSGLTKPERARDGRNSEAPMRAPSYGMQNAQVDHELRFQPPNKGSSPPPRPPSQQSIPQQNYSPQQQHSQQHQPNHHQPPRPLPPNAPQRAMSQPPMNGPGPGPGPGPRSPVSPIEGYSLAQQSRPPQNVRGPAGGVPQSSFGPPPQGNGPPLSQPILTGLDDRRDTRQRTMSNPSHPPPVGLGPNSGGMRRVVTDGRPPDGQAPGQIRPLYPQHSGPQPGQIFHHPSSGPVSPFPNRPNGSISPGPQPGQIFNQPQPGQIYQQRPPPPPSQGQYGGPALGPQVSRPLPPPGGGNWEPPQRLPPGAGPPNGQQFRPPPPGQVPIQGYDPRRGPPPQPYSPQQAFYGGQPPPRPQTQPQVGQVYGYQNGGAYGHHR